MHQSLNEMAVALREGRLRSTDICAEAAENWRIREPRLNAYRTWNGGGAAQDAALADALFAQGVDLGPLQGLPVSVKDLYGVRGLPIFAGSPKALPHAWQKEGPVVNTLRRQQAVITGKTHTVEFAFGVLGLNSHWGAPRNPWDGRHHRVPGGSSAGAGVSLWQGTARIALGTDTAASVRAPASFTGVVGLKTSWGRWSRDGIVPLSPSFDTPGPMTLSAADMAYAFAALDPETSRDFGGFIRAAQASEIAGCRIGICEALFDAVDPGIAEAVEAALTELAKVGARIVRQAIPNLAEVFAFQATGGISAMEMVAFLDRELPDWLATVEPDIGERLDAARKLPASDYLARVKRIADLRAAAAPAFNAVDFLITPTVAITPPRIDEVTADVGLAAEATRRALRNVSVVNMLGWCAATMPIGVDAAGMPVGLQLIAPANADAHLVSALWACERVLGAPQDRLGRPPL